MKKPALFRLLPFFLVAACDTVSVPITMPSSVNIGSSQLGASSGSPQGLAERATQVWFVPNLQSDVLEMFRHPGDWPRAQANIDFFGIFTIWAYDHPGFECGSACGPNTLKNFLSVVPGGAFKWLADRNISIDIEAAALKEYDCNGVQANIFVANTAIANVVKNGGKVVTLSMDEPFFGNVVGNCQFSIDKVAEIVRTFGDGVNQQFPEVQLGLIEPYPSFSIQELEQMLLALERRGVMLSFFRLDFSQAAAQKGEVLNDFREIREFCRQRRLPFGIIIWGADASSNETYVRDAWTMAVTNFAAVGVTEHTVVQSWSEQKDRDLSSPRFFPQTLPESNSVSHTGFLLRVLKYYGVLR